MISILTGKYLRIGLCHTLCNSHLLTLTLCREVSRAHVRVLGNNAYTSQCILTELCKFAVLRSLLEEFQWLVVLFLSCLVA